MVTKINWRMRRRVSGSFMIVVCRGRRGGDGGVMGAEVDRAGVAS